MMMDLVLDETERKAKRKLIERNREKKGLDHLTSKYKRSCPVLPINELKTTVDKVAKAYCSWIDPPLIMSPHFRFTDPAEQFSSLMVMVLTRSFGFMKAFDGFQSISLEQNLDFISGCLQVRILRTLHRIDSDTGNLLVESETLINSPKQHLNGIPLSDFQMDKTFMKDLKNLAESFQILQLTTEELALLSAIFSFPKSLIERVGFLAATTTTNK